MWRRTLLVMDRFPEDHIGRAGVLCNLGKLMMLSQRRNTREANRGHLLAGTTVVARN